MLLDDSNYPAWKSYMKNRLEDEGLWGITLGTELIPSQDQLEATIEEFKKKSRLAFYLIIKSIDDSVIFSVSAFEFENNPSELWKVLQSKYQPNDLLSKFEAFKKLKSLQFDQNDPDQFIDLIRDCFAELDQVGLNLDESAWMVLFLSQLPAHVADSILVKPEPGQDSSDSQPTPITSCEYLFEKLRSLPAQQLNPSTKINLDQKLQGHHSTGIVLSCQKCHRKGHNVDRCWIAHPELSPFGNTKTKFGPPPPTSSDGSNSGNRNVNNNHNKFNHRRLTGANDSVAQQRYQDHNSQDQSNHENDNRWTTSYQNNNQKERKYQNSYRNHDYNKNRDNSNEFIKTTFQKFLPGSANWTPHSQKRNQKDDRSGPLVEENQGWDNNKDNENNQNNIPAQTSEWSTSGNAVDYTNVSRTGWTENVADFTIAENPPNQWPDLDDQK